MSTRCLIGIEETIEEISMVRWIYCHMDGYPGWTGSILLDSYANYAVASALIQAGYISQLEASVETCQRRRDNHGFNENLLCDFTSMAQEGFMWAEYAYLFTKEGRWEVMRCNPSGYWIILSHDLCIMSG